MVRRKPLRSPLRAGELLAKWIKRKQLEPDMIQYEICDRWSEFVGEKIAGRTNPRTLHDGILTVIVVNNSWLNELSFLKDDLARQVNEGMNNKLVTSVKLVLGNISNTRRSSLRTKNRKDAQVVPNIELPSEYLNEVEDELKPIADPPLYNAIKKARLAFLRKRLWKKRD